MIAAIGVQGFAEHLVNLIIRSAVWHIVGDLVNAGMRAVGH